VFPEDGRVFLYNYGSDFLYDVCVNVGAHQATEDIPTRSIVQSKSIVDLNIRIDSED
jgi:hypothetical protein